jgi:organic radical activating enzyme
MRVSNLVIEVTRKCNMACDHCLRGCAQNMDIEEKTLNNVFSKISSIGTLTVTGGEPSLVPEKINAIVEIAKNYNVSIDRFYMVTNGKQVSDEFLKAVLNLYLYCDDKSSEGSLLQYSDDMFHEGMMQENKEKLEAFRFVSSRNDSHIDEYNCISEGRAEENGIGDRKKTITGFSIDEYSDEFSIEDGELYINCKGNILSCCDLSYHSQDIKALIIGNVNRKNFNFETAIRRFNKSLEKMDDTSIDTFKYENEFAS